VEATEPASSIPKGDPATVAAEAAIFTLATYLLYEAVTPPTHGRQAKKVPDMALGSGAAP